VSQLTVIDSNSFAAVDRQVIDITGHPVKGPAAASVTIIVFPDYLCPACNGLEPMLHQVLENYPDNVKLVNKLCPKHDFSREAIEAAYAAWDQDKFWEYHDLLFYYQLVLN
jgi:protein-disulfide isomerase